ncbi:hypothetical protein EMIT0373P_10667 [Pseudomonas chlororaphis]
MQTIDSYSYLCSFNSFARLRETSATSACTLGRQDPGRHFQSLSALASVLQERVADQGRPTRMKVIVFQGEAARSCQTRKKRYA